MIRWGQNNLAISLLSSGGIFSWILLNQERITLSTLDLIVAFLPFIITGAFGLMSLLAYQRLLLVGSYMAAIEGRLSFRDLGWHKHIRDTKGFRRFRNFVALAWLALLFADLALALVIIGT